MLSLGQARYLLIDVLGEVTEVVEWAGGEGDPIRCLRSVKGDTLLSTLDGTAPCSVSPARLVHVLESKRYDLVRGFLLGRLGSIPDENTCSRASGDAVCGVCGWKARNHFSHPASPPTEAHLVVMCDGSVYKL